jgi:hypothetical protein
MTPKRLNEDERADGDKRQGNVHCDAIEITFYVTIMLVNKTA